MDKTGKKRCGNCMYFYNEDIGIGGCDWNFMLITSCGECCERYKELEEVRDKDGEE